MKLPRRGRLLLGGALVVLAGCGPVDSCAPTPAPPVVVPYIPYVPQTIVTLQAPSATQAPPQQPLPPVIPIPPILPPPPTSQPKCGVQPYWGSLLGNTVCIAQDQIDEWTKAALDNPSGWVDLYHGSVDNGLHLQVAGFDFGTTGTYISRDYRVALDTACNPRHLPNWRTGYDRWILRSRIPQSIFDKYFAPFETGYSGWSGTLPGTTQIQLTNDLQIAFFNYGINNWGENIFPVPHMPTNAELYPPNGVALDGGCGIGYYTLPYAQPVG